MSDDRVVIGYDVGTGGSKAVLVSIDGRLLSSDFRPYGVHHPKPHYAEQDPQDWWDAVVDNTRNLLRESGVEPGNVAGISFSSQMLGVLPVSKDGECLSRGIIWMDCRAGAQADRIVRKLGGERVLMTLVGAVPSGKDVVCKIKWIEECEPDTFERTHAFLDVKAYLVYRATGRLLTEQTAASVTGIMDKKTREWSWLMGKLLGFPLEKMPPVQRTMDVAGEITAGAAGELGLPRGTPVVAGMGDAPAGAIGAGALDHGEAAVSVGTSGLLLITVSRKVNLGRFGMASIAAASPDKWLLVGETNTAGGCLNWFAEQLASGEQVARSGGSEEKLFKVLDDDVLSAPAGAGKLIFTPWMFGERAPVTDSTLRGAFVNLSLDHGRGEMLRAVYEGVAMNFRWMFDAAAARGLACRTVRAIGGGATSDEWMQIFADVTGRRIEAVETARVAGAIGAALAVPVALGIYRDYSDIKDVVRVRKAFDPDPGKSEIYGELYTQFRRLYKRLSPVYRTLNR